MVGSTYKGLALFDSGPHRFGIEKIGLYVVSNAALDPTFPGAQSYGELDLAVVVTGRLVAATDAALWALVDAIDTQLSHPPVAGTLVDHHGRSWANMSFIRFEAGEKIDRGREVSLSYTAKFLRVS